MNIAIIDDNSVYAEKLKDLVHDWSNSSNIPVSINIFYDATDFLTQFIKTGRWSVIISDVQMPGLNGMELAKRIREADTSIPLIFVSNFLEYSLQGYEVNAVRFLHKEAFNFREKLFESLQTAQKALQEHYGYDLSLKSDGNFYKLSYSDIFYFEQSAHIVKIHTENEVLSYRATMKDILNFVPSYYVVTSRSHIVNLYKVVSITNSGILLCNNETIPLTHSNRTVVISKFKENKF